MGREVGRVGVVEAGSEAGSGGEAAHCHSPQGLPRVPGAAVTGCHEGPDDVTVPTQGRDGSQGCSLSQQPSGSPSTAWLSLRPSVPGCSGPQLGAVS